MININDILPLREASDDYSHTEKIKARFNAIKDYRVPLYINLKEFDEILLWKLRNQYGRQKDLRRMNTESVVQDVTRLALSIQHEDKEYETELKIGLLCSIKGVGVPVASSILALIFPNDYCVIDFRGWRQVFGEMKNTFSISDYKRYLSEVRKIAEEISWPVQEVDLAIWELDRRRNAVE